MIFNQEIIQNTEGQLKNVTMTVIDGAHPSALQSNGTYGEISSNGTYQIVKNSVVSFYISDEIIYGEYSILATQSSRRHVLVTGDIEVTTI